MKKLLVLMLLLSVSCIVYSQNYKFNTTSVAMQNFNETTGQWGNWSDWVPTNVVVYINTNNSTISIYSSTTQNYDIVKVLDHSTDAYGNETLKWQGIDASGTRCVIRLVITASRKPQLYIDYSNMVVVYSLIKV